MGKGPENGSGRVFSLSHQAAQAIVEEIGRVVKQNINLMDEQGAVIASTDLSRVGTIHEAAARMVQEGITELCISESQATATARQGVNLSIFHEGKAIGVIGITGPYGEVAGYGQVVKKMVEILIRENVREDERRMGERVEARFLEDWVLGDGLMQPQMLAERGFRLGIDTTYTFGKQKGGTPEILNVLEKGMVRYAALIKEKLGVDVDGIPGSGAAGGLGAAFCVFLKAGMKSGIDTVLDLIHFDELLDGVDLVITGEGRMDWQSAYGKVPSGIGARCKAKNIPVVAIVGGMGDKAETIFDFGIDSIVTTINGAMPIEEALDRSEELYSSAADRTFRLLRAGMRLR